MAKQDKVETREVVYGKLAALMAKESEDVVDRYKEGLLMEEGGDTFIIRAIKKKNEPEAKDHIMTYEFDEEGNFLCTDLKEKDE